jgi:predicted O-linked N-acetylglucosamine transferase (SPINDLY family)
MSLLRRVRDALAVAPGADCDAEVEAAIGLFERGRIAEADKVCAHVLAREPDHAPALHLRGLVALGRGEAAHAAALIGAAVVRAPEVALYHFNLGNALRELGRPDEAAARYARATELEPGRFAAWFNLAQLHADARRPAEAAAAFRRALTVEPDHGAARLGLAAALVESAQDGVPSRAASEQILALLETGWAQTPEPLRARFYVAIALSGAERWTEAVPHFEAVVREHPDAAEARNQLANCYNRLGRARDAMREYRATFRAAPHFHHALTSVLGTINYDPDAPSEAVLEAHREWAASAAAAYYPRHVRFDNDRDPGKRLRVGYVSPDLRRHPVSALFAPVLARHDPGGFETFCYYGFPRSDAITERLRAAADHWRDVAGLSDAALADAVRADRIDILVDLAGHTRHGRLLAFARRPAPVQVSWLGYFNTTGLATIDYFVTDPVSSPPGQERYFVEKLVRLPATRFCYEPPEYMPEVSALPARRNGYVTFGCLNNLAKVHDGVLALWARVLAAVPDARLVLQASALNDPLRRAELTATAARVGIAPDRLELRRFVPAEEAATTYHGIDIALDPFPFCGGMTTLDALWMGVPVVTLPQTMIAGRQSASMLANLGLHDLIAQDADAYVGAASRLAADLDALARLRAGLRERFRASPLADYARFTADLECAYRSMWREWLGA